MKFKISSVTYALPPEVTTHVRQGEHRRTKETFDWEFHTIEFSTLEELREFQVKQEEPLIISWAPRPYEFKGLMLDGSITIYDDYIE